MTRAMILTAFIIVAGPVGIKAAQNLSHTIGEHTWITH